MELADVPVDKPPHRRTWAFNLRMAEIVANRNAPGNVDGLSVEVTYADGHYYLAGYSVVRFVGNDIPPELRESLH